MSFLSRYAPSHRVNLCLCLVIFASALGLAIGRIHVRVQNTLIGYEIGHLKQSEAQLLEERSHLRMQLAQLTTRKHLTLMSEAEKRSTDHPGIVAIK